MKVRFWDMNMFADDRNDEDEGDQPAEQVRNRHTTLHYLMNKLLLTSWLEFLFMYDKQQLIAIFEICVGGWFVWEGAWYWLRSGKGWC